MKLTKEQIGDARPLCSATFHQHPLAEKEPLNCPTCRAIAAALSTATETERERCAKIAEADLCEVCRAEPLITFRSEVDYECCDDCGLSLEIASAIRTQPTKGEV